MVNLDILDARFYAGAVRTRQAAKDTVDGTPDDNRILLMLDLASSTNHRFFRGPSEAYQRTVVFYGICQAVFAYAHSVQILKEMGDGILAVASDFTEALEACFLLKRMERMIRREFPDESFPFGIRIGLGHGPLKRLASPRPDFLGSAIDDLSRIMTDKSVAAGLFVSRPFRDQAADALERYPFVQLGSLKWWSDPSSAMTHAPIEYYVLDIDFAKMTVDSPHFVPWAPFVGTKYSRKV